MNVPHKVKGFISPSHGDEKKGNRRNVKYQIHARENKGWQRGLVMG